MLLYQAAELLAIKEIVDHGVVFRPERKGLAILLSRALIHLAGQAGNRGERAFHRFYYLSDSIIVRVAGELVAATFAADTGDHLG